MDQEPSVLSDPVVGRRNQNFECLGEVYLKQSKTQPGHLTVRYITVRYGAVLYSIVRYGTVRTLSKVQYGTVQYGTQKKANPRFANAWQGTIRYGT